MRPWKVCGSGSLSAGASSGTGSVTVVVVVDVVVDAVAAVAPRRRRGRWQRRRWPLRNARRSRPQRVSGDRAREAALTARAQEAAPGRSCAGRGESARIAGDDRRCGRRSVLAEPDRSRYVAAWRRRPLGVGDARRHADAAVARPGEEQPRRRRRSTAASQRRWPGRYCGNACGQRLTRTAARLQVDAEMPAQFGHRRVDETGRRRGGRPAVRPGRARRARPRRRPASAPTSASRTRRP